MRPIACLLLLIATLCPLSAQAAEVVAHPGYKVVHIYPHSREAFTEGLFYAHGALYESTGMNGASFIRKLDLESGKVLQQISLDPEYFGEGIVSWGSRLIQLTWRTEVGFSYDLASLRRTGRFHYRGEGWGLTHDDHQLIMSDGSSTLRLLDPQSLQQTGSLSVTENGRPVPRLNELEWVKGRIYANVWLTRHIVVIDPRTGHVTADIDLGHLLPSSTPLANPTDDVLNGIAWDAEHDRLFVTGKCWPYLYEIKLLPAAAGH